MTVHVQSGMSAHPQSGRTVHASSGITKVLYITYQKSTGQSVKMEREKKREQKVSIKQLTEYS